jgi:hypothetical protein
VEEINKDIQTARRIADDIQSRSKRLGFEGRVTDTVIRDILGNPNADFSDSYRSLATWLYYDTGACFLQDADNLIMKTDDLVEVLTHLKRLFPEIRRITTYSRSKTVIKKSVDALGRIRQAGLDRIHIGLETGFDPLLQFMQKGVTAEEHVDAGRRVIQAGMELSEYIMPGLGGQEMWQEHARESAAVLNRINPHFIRLRSLRIPKRVPLHAKLAEGLFRMQSDDMLAREISHFLKHLEGITSTITSDHMMNLLPEIDGKLPDDKEAMLNVVTRYFELSDLDRLIYRVGRRGGAYEGIADLTRDAATYAKIKQLITDVRLEEGAKGVEHLIAGLVDRYV